LRYTVGHEALAKLLSNLRAEGYVVLGPKLVDGVVRLSEVRSLSELAKGVLDLQSPGRYRTTSSGDKLFSAVNGPFSVKTYLHPAEAEVARVSRSGGGYETSVQPFDTKYAFFGLRPCDLAAVRVLDRALLVKDFEEPTYASLRKHALFAVVNCGRSGDTCFCASMGTGPKVSDGFDIALTELPGRFLVDVSEACVPLFEGADLSPASVDDIREEQQLMEDVTSHMKKRIEIKGPAHLMYEGVDSPVWEDAAQRCLACGNCTMVCPTCFCNSVREVNDLVEGSVAKVRIWDSCLSRDFTYAAGGNPRKDRKSRYRQFVMHKFAYWTDQFDLYGCVGCGRCITWCPVGIDISDTVNRIVRGQGSGLAKEVARVG
jgi:ferredoxin